MNKFKQTKKLSASFQLKPLKKKLIDKYQRKK